LGGFGGSFGVLWEALGSHLASFGSHLGVLVACFGQGSLGEGPRERFGRYLGAFWSHLGGILESFGSLRPHLGGILELLGRYLGALCNKSCKLKLQARALSKTGKLERKAGVHGSS
jgi:hypothetical protein